jgi:hypothetical protein
MNQLSQFAATASFTVATVALALGTARAQVVDFTGLNLAAVSSTSGENFAVTGGSLNVRLISGDVSALDPGFSPDPTGFYVHQVPSNLTPAVFQFTLPTPQTFVITQNESLTALEVNGFSSPSNPWTVLSAANATVTTSNGGLQVGFQGTTNNPPYGTFQLLGSGQSFNFTVADSAGFDEYGSAISLNLTGKSAAAAPEPASVGLLALGALSFGIGVVRRRRG